jgi:hypothetical protein
MEKKISLCAPIIFLLVIFMSCGLCFSEKKSRSDKEKELGEILKACAEYCEKLTNASIHFVCEERILEEIYHYRPGTYFSDQPLPFDKEKSTFVYEFQFKLEGMRIEESRILLEENSQEKHEENAPLKTRHYGQENIFLEPVSFLSEDCQAYHRYRILGRERLKGEKTVVIEVIPSDQESDDLTGKVWVRDSDYCILKIETAQRTLKSFDGVEQTSNGILLEPHITFILEFLYEKDGFIFPTKYCVREEYNASFNKKRKLIRSETIVAYKDYKF